MRGHTNTSIRQRLFHLLLFVLVAISLLSFMIYLRVKVHGPRLSNTVRVAAIQCYSDMGETLGNLDRLIRLVREAKAKGAKIVIAKSGDILAMNDDGATECVVIADLPIGPSKR